MRPGASPSAILLADDGADGSFHPLDDGRTRVEHHVTSFQKAGFGDVVLVRRREATSLVPTLSGLKVVLSPAQRGARFESLLLGLFAVDGVPAFVQPASSDLVSTVTLSFLLERMERADAAPFSTTLNRHSARRTTIAYAPTYRGRIGFPMVLMPHAVERLVRGSVDLDHKPVREAILATCGGGVAMVEVEDPAVVSSTEVLGTGE